MCVHYFCTTALQTPLCGTHALERVGKIKSQTIQKGGFFDSEDEKGVFGKKGGARVGFRSYFTKLWGGGMI